MLDLETINNTIEELEKQEITFDICSKLASLYIIRDNLTRKNGHKKPQTDKAYNK